MTRGQFFRKPDGRFECLLAEARFRVSVTEPEQRIDPARAPRRIREQRKERKLLQFVDCLGNSHQESS